MAGLGDAMSGMQPQAQMGGDDGEQPNVSPEEQQQYDTFVKNGLRLIYTGTPTTQDDHNSPLPTDLIQEGRTTVDVATDQAISPNVLKALKGGDNPIMNLAVAGVTIVTGLRDSAKKAGAPISDDVLFHGATAILEELAEVAELTKIHDYTEQEMEQALYTGLDMYRESATQTGDLDSEALKQGFEQIRQADAEGRLGEILPGIDQKMQEAQQGARGGAQPMMGAQ